MKTQVSSSFRYGSREKFMVEFSFEEDPAAAWNTPEEVASWGSLKLWAGGYNLCTHYELGELREAVNWNWWGFIKWFQENWDPLFHEQALPVRNAGEWAAGAMMEINHPESFETPTGWNERFEKEADAWFRRHCIWSCRNGGLLPNVSFRRFRDRVEVSWTSHSPPGAPGHYRFQLTDGGVRLPVEEVVEPLHQFLSHAARFVAEKCETSAAKNLEKKISALEGTAAFDTRLAWLAGFGKKTTEYVRTFKRKLADLPSAAKSTFFPETTQGLAIAGHCEGALMFGAVAPELENSDRLTIAREILTHREENGSRGKLDGLVGQLELPVGDDRPWCEGYDLAEEWMKVSGVDSSKPLDMEQHLAGIGVEVKDVKLTGRGTSGVAVHMDDCPPLILLNVNCTRHQSPEGNPFASGRRFTLAHELCHLLIDREAGSDLAIVSGPWAPRSVEQRANAFAAALLMPDQLIVSTYKELGSHPSSDDFEILVKAARQLQVSPDALSRHLYNRKFITEAECDLLRSRLTNNSGREIRTGR